MLDLICYHQYIWGTIAADRSRWHSDGFSDGVAPLAGGGLKFSTPQSRVAIPRRDGDPWGAMALSLWKSLPAAQQGGGTLVDADGCFRVSLDGLQAIVVEILNYTLTVPIDWLSLGNWVSFYFWHDGVNQLDCGYEYELLTGDGGGVCIAEQCARSGPPGRAARRLDRKPDRKPEQASERQRFEREDLAARSRLDGPAVSWQAVHAAAAEMLGRRDRARSTRRPPPIRNVPRGGRT